MPKAEMSEADFVEQQRKLLAAYARELVRLREALTKIRDEKISNLSICFVMRDIAHAALHTDDSGSPAGEKE